MKKLLALLFTLFVFPSFPQSQWELIHGSNNSFNLSDVFVTDTNHTWAINGGSIWLSSDKGLSWTQQYDNPDYLFSDVFFIDSLTGWIVGWSEVLKTEDGGINWTPQTLPNPLGLDVEAVFFLNPDTGWIAGSYRMIFVTYDGGNNWIAQHESEWYGQYFLRDIHFYDKLHGCAVGGGLISHVPTVMTTFDGGNSWTDINVVNDGTFNKVQFMNDTLVWGINDALYKSTDGGITWELHQRWQYFYAEDFYFFNENHAILNDMFTHIITNDGWENYELFDRYIYDSFDHFEFYNDQEGIGVGSNNFMTTTDGGYTWNRLNERFLGIGFFDNMNGWIIQMPMNKELMHTTDGGYTWNKVETGLSGFLRQMSLPTESVGYIISSKSELLKTTNAGNTWEIIDLPFDSVNVAGLQFLDENIGFLSADPDRIFKTNNGGLDWTEINTGTIDRLDGYYFISPLEGWVVSWDGYCGLTKDGGLSWYFQTLPSDGLWGIKFINENTGFLTTARSEAFRSSDGGKTWEVIDLFIPQSKQVEFTDSLNGWITGIHTIYRTQDGGITWNEFYDFSSSNFEDEISDLFVLNSQKGWVCTADGRVFSISDLTGINENHLTKTDIKYYPNPVKDFVNVEINETIHGDLSIRIFSIEGRLIQEEVYTNVQDRLITIDCSMLTKGMYLMDMKALSFSKTIKIVKD